MMEKWTQRRENYFHTIFKSHTLCNTKYSFIWRFGKGDRKGYFAIISNFWGLINEHKIH